MGRNHISIEFSQTHNQYENASKEELIGVLTGEEWSDMGETQKLQLFQAIGNRYAKEHGISEPPTIQIEEDKNKYGGYRNWSNTITINPDRCKNPFEALDTVIHEENHAYQEQCIVNNNGKYTDAERALLKSQNGQAYKSEGIGYHRQSLEIDSNNVAVKNLISKKEQFKANSEYKEYMSERAKYYEKIVADYTNNNLEARMSEMKQIEEAFGFHEINSDEKKMAEDCVYCENNTIRSESIRLNGEVKQTFEECSQEQQEDSFAQDDGLNDILNISQADENICEMDDGLGAEGEIEIGSTADELGTDISQASENGME